MLRCTIALVLVAGPAFAAGDGGDLVERALAALHEAESGPLGYATAAAQGTEALRLLAPILPASTEPAVHYAAARASIAAAEPRGPETADPALLEKAIAEAERARALDPSFAAGEVAALLADASARLGHYERAAVEYDRALAAVEAVLPDGEGRDDTRARLLENGAEVQMALGHLGAAIARFGLATRAVPVEGTSRSLASWGLAVALDRDGQTAAARDAVRRALGASTSEMPEGLRDLTAPYVYFIPPGDKHYYFGLGFLVLGRRDEAIDSFRLYLDKQPRSRWAARARAHLGELARMPAIAGTAPDEPTFPSDMRVECQGSVGAVGEVLLAPLCACAPGPGDTSIVVTVDKRGAIVRATAEPREDAVEACVIAAMKGRRAPWRGERVRVVIGRLQR